MLVKFISFAANIYFIIPGQRVPMKTGFLVDFCSTPTIHAVERSVCHFAIVKKAAIIVLLFPIRPFSAAPARRQRHSGDVFFETNAQSIVHL
jgi:hypothetical protein